MSEHIPQKIAIRFPAGLSPDWAEHKLTFTTEYGPGQSSTNTIFLTTDELRDLHTAVFTRLYGTGEPS